VLLFISSSMLAPESDNRCSEIEHLGLSSSALMEYVPPAGHSSLTTLPFRKGLKSRIVSAVLVLPGFCNAHISFALLIRRRLLTHAFLCAVSRTLTKFGIAIAAILGIQNKARASVM